MVKYLLNSISLFLAVVAAAALVFCARGMVSGESVSANKQQTRLTLATQDGLFFFSATRISFPNSEVEQQWRAFRMQRGAVDSDDWQWSVQTGISNWGPLPDNILGFGLNQGTRQMRRRFLNPPTESRLTVSIPFWFIIPAAGFYPCWRLLRRMRTTESRSASGHCTRCGFDLQSVYHHCPKCGQRQPLPQGFPVHSWSN